MSASSAPDADSQPETVSYWFGGRWCTWAEYKAAQVERVMPRQPKRQWGKR